MKTLKPSNDVKLQYVNMVPLFESLDLKTKTFLAVNSTLNSFDKGDFLFNSGDPASVLNILIRGGVSVFVYVPNGDKKVLHFLKPPSLIGEAAVFMGEEFPAYAQTIEESLVLKISRATLLEITRENPQIPWKIVGFLFNRLKHFSHTIETHARKSAVTRVCVYLQSISGNKKQFDLPAPKKEIANFLGLRPESFSRAVSVLQKNGAIELTDSHVIIKNCDMLEEILEEN
jgi:CRP/FNR family transcriptional regulator, dissimilatory nitrate respiration regulator